MQLSGYKRPLRLLEVQETREGGGGGFRGEAAQAAVMNFEIVSQTS